MNKNDDRRLDRPGGRREWTNALWAALEKVSDRELAPLSDNASPAHQGAREIRGDPRSRAGCEGRTMSANSFNRRLDRLAGGNGVDLAAALDAGWQRARSWRDEGNTGPMMPCEQLAPPPENGTRAARKMWRTIAESHARVAFMPNKEFDALQAAYAMNDADLWRTVFQREQAA